jgi:hypothetical protein
MRYICLITRKRHMLNTLKNSLIIFLILCIVQVASAQNMQHRTVQLGQALSKEEINELFLPSRFRLTNHHEVKSLTSTHQQYKVDYEGITVFNAMVKSQVFKTGKQILTLPTLGNIEVMTPHENMIKAVYSWGDFSLKANDNLFVSAIYYPQGNGLIPAYEVHISGSNREDLIIYDQSQNILEYRDLILNTKPDSLIATQVFSPDPLTSAKLEYGTPYLDSEDANTTWLREQLQLDSIWVRWDTNLQTWSLTSDFARAFDIDDTGVIAIAPPTSTNGIFNFERGDDGFEYVNAFYHINKQAQYLIELGYDSLMTYAIKFDAYGRIDDQSSFISAFSDDPYLIFGVGGVDDAEDADVIVHEYGHAISFAAAPETNTGKERQALDEGFCDYLAYSYSISISDFNSRDLFNWDGHNEFWGGREIPNFRSYPSDLQNNIYGDGLIWTSALSEISSLIGRKTTDQLAIETLFSFYPNMLLSDAAAILLRNDSLLNNAENANTISRVLCLKGLLPGCEDTTVTTAPLRSPYLGNTDGFFNGAHTLMIYPNKTIISGYSVYNAMGKLIKTEEMSSEGLSFFEISLPLQNAGFYLLTLETNEGTFSFKLVNPAR